MFKKLKDKIAEDLKFSPQRLTQGTNEKTQSNNSNDENFFSIADDDAVASTSSLGGEFTDVSLHASTPMETRSRKLSNSSMASDISFLPRYEPSGNLYHMQSDLDVSASEIEDNMSTSSQLGHISKEQVYSAFQKAQMRYHKYRGRYTDIANHYKILEKENAKIRSILVDTQDKAIRRVNELKEQCTLEQKAKAHLENALRVELDEKQIKIDTLHTKIKLLQNGDRSEQLIDVSDNSRSTSNSSLSENQELTKYLNDARVEIENLNGRLQEMKANAIIFNTKEADYKSKIQNLEKSLQERNSEINHYSEREKENNLKLAQSKMELHAEIHNKDLEIANLKRELDRSEKTKANVKLENLQSQNAKLIDKVDSLNQKCSNYESELIKLEQHRIEIGNLNEIVLNLKKINEELVQKKLETEVGLKESYEGVIKGLEDELNALKLKFDESTKENEEIKRQNHDLTSKLTDFNNSKQTIDDLKANLINFDFIKEENQKLQTDLQNLQGIREKYDDLIQNYEELNIEKAKIDEQNQKLQKQTSDYEKTIEKIREDAKQSLLTLEMKIKKKFEEEFTEKETKVKEEFESKLKKLLSSTEDAKKIEIDLMQSQDLLKKVENEKLELVTELALAKTKYTDLENNHLELINENAQTRKELAILEKENNTQKNMITTLEGDIQAIREEMTKLYGDIEREKSKSTKFQEELLKLKEEVQNTDEIDGMKSEISNLEAVLLEKDQEQHRMRKNHEEELFLKISEFGVLQKEFSLLQDVSIKQQNENCQLQDEKRDLQKEIDGLNEQIKAGHEKQRKLDETNEDIKHKKERIADLIKEIEKFKSKYADSIKINEDLQSRLKQFEEEQMKLKETNENILQQKLGRIADLEEELQQFQKKWNETNNDLMLKIEEKTSLDVRIEEYEKINEDLLRKIGVLEEENVNVKDSLKSLLKNNSNFTEELSKYSEENGKLKNEIKNYSTIINDLENEVKKVQKEKFNITEELKIKENEKKELNETIEDLKQYETKYQGILDENHNLKEQISKIEELKLKLKHLESLENDFRTISKEKESLLKDLGNLEKQKNEITNDNKKLKQEILDLKVLNEKLKDFEEENSKLVENITELQSQINFALSDNQNLSGELSKYHQIEVRYNDLAREAAELQARFQQLTNENIELLERNQQLTGDYKQILHENERSSNDYAELKLSFEQIQTDLNNFEALKRDYEAEIETLRMELASNKEELSRIQGEKFSLEKLQSSTVESSENQTSSLKTKIKQLQEEKSDYESLFNEYKQMKTDINNITQLYDKCLKDKKEIEVQLQELERHYSEMLHEKQLLKDEIQELKISPLNLTNKSNKLDNLEVLKAEKKYNINEENYLKEIENLRDKLEQYKSIDKANRASIEFYENEMQKLKVKNEKLTRKLDDTLVTLPVLSGGNDLGDSQAKLEYLRNVLFNYMIGRESLVLAKVITAVCKFNKEQTELIMQKEQQRQTLLGQLFGS
ncbi:hypothetical protein Trydic_g20410 [Trypoxylus dichotomus]